MQLMTPALVKLYAASVAVNIRAQALMGVLKTASFLEPDELWNAVEVCDQLSRRQMPLTGALQLAEPLLMKLPAEYKLTFGRKVVLREYHLTACFTAQVRARWFSG